MKSPSKTTRRKSAHPTHEDDRPAQGKWGWHYRTLLALRDHLAADPGDRTRELADAMEPPSLHPEDLSDELYDRVLAASLPPGRAEAHREIEDALNRIRAGKYGRCEATGRLISAAQLRAMPWCRYAAPVPAKPAVHAIGTKDHAHS